jgi:cell division septal protein FtsQ
MKMVEKKDGKIETALRLRLRRRKRTIFKISFLSVLFVFILSIFILNADAFKVKVVEVSGVERVSAEEVYARSNIEIGENIFTLPIGSIRDGIMDREPLVKKASVRRIVPSKVRIEISERQPFAYVTDGVKYYLIDNERVVIERPNGIADKNLFLIVTDSLQHAEVGEKLAFPRYELFETMRVVLDKALKGWYRQVIFNKEGIKLILRDGTYVLLGDGNDIEKKIMLVPVIVKKLHELKEDYEGLNLTTIEVPSYIKKTTDK